MKKKSFSFAEKYTKGVSAVESILTLDHLRQSVAVKELEQTRGGPQLSMRKTCSVPNFSQVSKNISLGYYFHTKTKYVSMYSFFVTLILSILQNVYIYFTKTKYLARN
jgi:hypothetical protein